MNDIRYIIPLIFVLVIVFLIILFHLRKKAIIKKLNSLTLEEKKTTLDKLGAPIGYTYDINQDIFAARVDAPQKPFGYSAFYDTSAPFFNMVFDCEPIYFNYDNKTWLIELWKGQYGINTGCELGIYYADEIISPDKYDSTLFHSAKIEDMLEVSLRLNRLDSKNHSQHTRLGDMQKKHWWLTIFKMGIFTYPKDLLVNVSIRFKDSVMLQSFLESFRGALPHTPYKVNGLKLYFSFCKSERSNSFFQKTVRNLALMSCHFYCRWFHYLTRPFETSGDKLLYLYYYLPFTLRFIFKHIPGK